MLRVYMARPRHKLTTLQVKNTKAPGRLSDGGGLYLHIGKNGGKSWVHIWKRNKRKREMGLGSVADVSLSMARKKADKNRLLILDGRDPINERKKENVPNFKDCAQLYYDNKKSGWKHKSHIANWKLSLFTHAKPLHRLQVSDIETPDVLKMLKPLWQTKPATASTLRGRVEAVLDYAKAMGWREGENPALWRGNLKSLLPPRTQKVKHFPALPVLEITAFMTNLQTRDALSARLLEFIILTACRSNEARGAEWDEFDIENALWTIPAIRMKAGKEHTVPLSKRALEIVSALPKIKNCDLVFPQISKRKQFSVNATRALLHRMGRADVTTHGFRSTFRDWAGDQTAFQRETIEAALAHGIKDKAEAAYRRSTAIEKRRKLMQAWADYCTQQTNEKVVQLHG